MVAINKIIKEKKNHLAIAGPMVTSSNLKTEVIAANMNTMLA